MSTFKLQSLDPHERSVLRRINDVFFTIKQEEHNTMVVIDFNSVVPGQINRYKNGIKHLPLIVFNYKDIHDVDIFKQVLTDHFSWETEIQHHKTFEDVISQTIKHNCSSILVFTDMIKIKIKIVHVYKSIIPVVFLNSLDEMFEFGIFQNSLQSFEYPKHECSTLYKSSSNEEDQSWFWKK
jgi:hypothetical protein